jgi:hypothetical protein
MDGMIILTKLGADAEIMRSMLESLMEMLAGGNKYETDTYRLKIPLHEQLKQGITDWTLLAEGKFHQTVIK